MKLAILAQAYLFDKTAPINGTLVQLYNLTQGFKSEHIDVNYIAVTKDATKPKDEVVEGVHFYWIQARPGILGWKKTMNDYRSVLNKVKPDAVYVRGRNVMQYVAGTYAKAHNITYVWGTNGDDSAEFNKNVKRLMGSNKSVLKKAILYPLKAYEDWYINKGMKMVQIVVNQSEEQKIATKQHLGKMGVVISSYFFMPTQETVTKKNLILWFANLSEAKQPELFIDIIKKIEVTNWKAILAGGTSIDSYQQKIDILSKGTIIKTLGKIDFKASFQYYNQAKIYINTSKPDADGLPNAYIQSWLSGAIVLSLHHDPNQWMKTHNIGYCSNGDIDKLVFKLQELVNNPELLAEMSHNAQSFAIQQFSNKNIINNYINLFKK
ncbi:glycosyltransferase family 4 protein [Winogradskyella sp. Asnod2-B02-A]|uniref:glycosyltransferase family 4 protein n=1 Tax=Winogradskyella sp. Asnod2-B02-A TaxID=3160583 RepID=UPI00386AF483